MYDLVASRLHQRGVPLKLLAWVDLLGFVSFLVFLILNGILCSAHEHNEGVAMLRAYTSVPWMFCCVIHGLIVAQFVLPYPFGNLDRHHVCDCDRDWKQHDGMRRDGKTYALLRDADDMEAQAGTSGRLDDSATAPGQRQQRHRSTNRNMERNMPQYPRRHFWIPWLYGMAWVDLGPSVVYS